MGVKRIAILGAGGVGQSAVKMLENKKELLLVALCDREGYAFSLKGIPSGLIDRLLPDESIAYLPQIGVKCEDSIGAIIDNLGKIDGILIALPNMPSTFIPGVIRKLMRAGFKGVIVDLVKRTQSIEKIIKMKSIIKKAGITYITGAGASPGILSSAASIAAQSFSDIIKIEINLGINLSNWKQYRSTVKEILLSLDGFTVDKIAKLSDDDIDKILNARKRIIKVDNPKNGDEAILEFAGVIDRLKTSVSVTLDTSGGDKKAQTEVSVTGVTFEGKTCKNKFIFSDETTIADNVCGSAMGFMKSGFWLQDLGIAGVFTSAEILPRYIR